MIPLSMAEGAACFQFKSGVNAEREDPLNFHRLV